MYLGRIVEEDGVESFSAAAPPYSQALLASMPAMEPEVTGKACPARDVPSLPLPTRLPFNPRVESWRDAAKSVPRSSRSKPRGC